jgi:hypothetical protein
MDEARRKIIMGAPLLSVSLFSGCGGGSDDPQASATGGRASIQSNSYASGQTLKATAANIFQGLDSIWQDNTGGNYLVPSASPVIQAVLNGSVLHVSIVETMAFSTGSGASSSTVKLALTNGSAPAVGTVYTLNGSNGSSGAMSALRRTTNTSSDVTTDDTFQYMMSNTSSSGGSVKIDTVNTATSVYKLVFTNVLFTYMSNYAGTKSFLVNGETSLLVPTQTVAWV